MFEIRNSVGANIGVVTSEELKKLKEIGMIRMSDTIIDLKTGKAINDYNQYY